MSMAGRFIEIHLVCIHEHYAIVLPDTIMDDIMGYHKNRPVKEVYGISVVDISTYYPHVQIVDKIGKFLVFKMININYKTIKKRFYCFESTETYANTYTKIKKISNNKLLDVCKCLPDKIQKKTNNGLIRYAFQTITKERVVPSYIKKRKEKSVKDKYIRMF